MDKVLEARGLTLDEYLKISYGIMKIPYTQRPYEWGKIQITRLFKDFMNAHNNKVEQHILNFITLFKEKDFINIYDGQQRTVSTIIILCVLLHKLKEMPNCDEEFIKGIEEDYIVKKNYRTKTLQYKLNFEDKEVNEFFRKYIIKGDFDTDQMELSEQQKTLMVNYQIVRDRIEESFPDLDDPAVLERLVDSITTKVFVIVLETSSEEVANQMFETLNNTGKKIADFYVLKNQLVRVLTEDEVKQDWDEVEKNLDSISKSKFLVAYTSTFNGKTSESGAYKAIEKNNKIKDRMAASDTLKELKKASLTYLHLETPLLRYTSDKEKIKSFHQLVDTMSMISANQYKSVIVAMELKNYKLDEVNQVLKALLNLHIRNIFIAQDKANTLEQFYPSLSQKIYTENISIDEVIKLVNEKMNKGEALKKKFMDRLIKSSVDKRIVRYILREIYNFENKDEVKVFEDAQYVNLEHILPQTPNTSSDWLGIFPDAEEREMCTQSIGNLTVLLGTKNSSGGNQDFENKKNIYSSSAIKHNQQLAKITEWDAKAIDNRSKNLYGTFIKVW